MACAQLELGVSKTEFLRMTPAEFFALLDYRRELRDEERQRADFRSGIIVATVESFGGAKKFEPFRYFPEHKKASPASTPSGSERIATILAYKMAKGEA